MTSVVIADDQEIIRSGLRMVLESQGIDVIGEAANGVEAVDAARRLRPDVVLMDIRMPVVNGIAATVTIVREQLPSRVLVLTTYDSSMGRSEPAPRGSCSRPRRRTAWSRASSWSRRAKPCWPRP